MVVAAPGYPGTIEKGAPIEGLDAAAGDPDAVVFHAGTARDADGRVVVSGGRVLGVTALGETIPAAVARAGEDLSVYAYGLMLHHCVEAADRLAAEEGFQAEVVDLRTLQPLDRETILASARKTGKAMVVHEDNRTFGAGAEIAALIAEEAFFDLDAPPVRLAGPDTPAMPFATGLEHAFLLDVERIYERMRELARF